MSCYHPLLGVPDYNPRTNRPYLTANGKVRYRIIPMGSASYETLKNDPDAIQVPCGKCVGCRLEYSRQWANRCMLELQYHKSAYFLTLTYNDGNLPLRWHVDESTGEAAQVATLVKRDWQLFMKRLRRSFPDQELRFFMSGEYGEQNFRPHFHAIVFGLEIPDLRFYKKLDKYDYYTSSKIQKIWDFGANFSHNSIDNPDQMVYNVDTGKWSVTPLTTRGLVIIGEVNWDTCAYTARYVMDKLKGPAATFYEEQGILPPFSLMSRRPGIGRMYYDDHDCYEYQYINVTTPQGGKKFQAPKYFDRLLERDDPERFTVIKEQRKELSKQWQEAKLAQSDLSYLDFLEVQEAVHVDRVKALERRL